MWLYQFFVRTFVRFHKPDSYLDRGLTTIVLVFHPLIAGRNWMFQKLTGLWFLQGSDLVFLWTWMLVFPGSG